MSIIDTVLAAREAELNNPARIAERLESMRKQAQQVWDAQALHFLGAKDELAIMAMMKVSLGFVDQAQQAINFGVNMVMGHVVWTEAYKNKTPGATMKVTAEATTGVDGTTRETLTLTFGDEYLGTVTRITGRAGAGLPMVMGLEVSCATSAAASRAAVQA